MPNKLVMTECHQLQDHGTCFG